MIPCERMVFYGVTDLGEMVAKGGNVDLSAAWERGEGVCVYLYDRFEGEEISTHRKWDERSAFSYGG